MLILRVKIISTRFILRLLDIINYLSPSLNNKVSKYIITQIHSITDEMYARRIIH